MDIYKTEYTGDKLLYFGAESNVPGHPVLHPLVKDDDQKSNYGVKHIFLQSAAG